MIVLNIKMEATPGAVAALKDAIAVLEKATRAEPGCIDYVFSSEIGNPSNIRIIEHWKDVDALKKHLTMPRSLAAFQEAVLEESAEGHASEDVRRDGAPVFAAVTASLPERRIAAGARRLPAETHATHAIEGSPPWPM